MSTEDARKLFVAGLPDTITEEILRQLFEATGGTVVDVSIPKDRATGRPRGFGFVTLSTSEEAASARDSLDGSVQAGRSISVRPFQAEPPRRAEGVPSTAPRGPAQAPMAPQPDRTLYVGNLPYDCTEQDVEGLLTGAGVTAGARVNLPVDQDGRRRGFGFVTMETAEAARDALEALRGVDMRGRRLVVNIAHPKGERPARSEAAPNPSGPRPSNYGPPRPSGVPSAPVDRPRPYGASPPADPPRKTFDDNRRRGTGRVETEAERARKRPKAPKERGRRNEDWRDDIYDDDE